MRHHKDTTTALIFTVTLVSLFSVCAADDDTLGKHTVGDPDLANQNPLSGTADPDHDRPRNKIVIEGKRSPSEAPIGNPLSNKVFRSLEKKEIGQGPDGIEVGHWFIHFSNSNFEWSYSDVSESGIYGLEGAKVIGRTINRQIPGKYDPDSGVLTWDGVDYTAVEAKD